MQRSSGGWPARCLLNDWDLWGRPAQLAPTGAWRTWLFLGGRGAGKTRAGAEWVAGLVRTRSAGRLALIAPTFHDVREVMIEGASGLRALSGARPYYEASRRRRLGWARMRYSPALRKVCARAFSSRRSWANWRGGCGRALSIAGMTATARG